MCPVLYLSLSLSLSMLPFPLQVFFSFLLLLLVSRQPCIQSEPSELTSDNIMICHPWFPWYFSSLRSFSEIWHWHHWQGWWNNHHKVATACVLYIFTKKDFQDTVHVKHAENLPPTPGSPSQLSIFGALSVPICQGQAIPPVDCQLTLWSESQGVGNMHHSMQPWLLLQPVSQRFPFLPTPTPNLPPVHAPQPQPAHDPAQSIDSWSSPATMLNELCIQLHETQASLAAHVNNICALEDMFTEHEAIRAKIASLHKLMNK